jgi:putative peptide zinc metalloprotease protein
MAELIASQAWPELRQDLMLLEGPTAAGGAPTWTLHDAASGRFFRLGWLEFEILSRWPLGGIPAITDAIRQQTSLHPAEQSVEAFVRFLYEQQLVVRSQPEDTDWLVSLSRSRRRTGLATWLLHNYLFFRIPLIHPQRWLSRALPWVRWAFTPTFLYLLVLGAGLGLYLISRQWEFFIHSFMYMFTLEGALLTGAALAVAKIVHELGHAFATVRFGCRVPAMGIAFIVLWPLLWTDTTDAWRLKDKSARLTVGAAGILAELTLAVVAALLWQVLPEGALRTSAYLLCTTTWVMTLGINLNPFMRFDGYFLLSDWLKIENLQGRSFHLARWWLRRILLGMNTVPPELWPIRTRRFLLIYALATWMYRLVLFLGIALLVYHFFFKALGIFLMIVEIGWFIVRPIAQELVAWHGFKDKLQWNRRNIATLAVVITGLVLLSVPWQNRVSAPGILLAGQETTLYARQAGRLEELQPNGSVVRSGQTVFRLSAPDLDDKIRLAESKVRGMEQKVTMQAVEQALSRKNPVDWQELQTFRAELAGLRQQREKLVLTAPFTGLLTDLPDDLRPGAWISRDEALATLIDPHSHRVVAYVQEEDLLRLQTGGTARFYPDNAQHAPLDLWVSEIGRTATQNLNYPEMASIHGGNLAVREDSDKKLVPEQAVYRVVLIPAEPKPTPYTHRLEIGSVTIAADRASPLSRLWRAVVAVVIRESGW